MDNIDMSSYEKIFYPKRLAVIGASDNIMKFGGMFLKALLDYGFKGEIYPVNPKSSKVQGIVAYPDVEAIPEDVDFAVITVPEKFVIDAVKSCARKGVKGVEILTSGFREAGEKGKILEKELVEIAKKGNVRIIGPNCFGVYSPAAGITLMPGVEFSREPGPVGFISQSGGGACDIAYMAQGRGVNFSTMVSYGNGCDINASELLMYFKDDPRTKIVGAYIEGVYDGRVFLNALALCAAKKPVVILKGGLTEQGQKGTIGHTGSMAGSSLAWKAAVKSTGAVFAKDTKDLVECLMAFKCIGYLKGDGAGILAGGGLRCVESLDAASEFGFNVPEPDQKTLSLITSLLPPAGGRAGNPVDLANPVIGPSSIIPMLAAFSNHESIDFMVLYQMLFYLLNELKRMNILDDYLSGETGYHNEITNAAKDIYKNTGKPLIVILPDIVSAPEHSEIEHGRIITMDYYTSNNIACFDSIHQAFSVLRRVAEYYKKNTPEM